MTEIWVTTDGDYSDYHVTGVWSSEEKAREFCKASGSDNMDCWKLDAPYNSTDQVVVERFECRMKEDGTVTSEKSKGKSIEDKGKRGKAYRSGRGFVGVSFMSPAHARKLCVERRQAWLRTPEFAPK